MTTRGDERLLTRRQEKEVLRCAAEVARSSRANPDRLGCPGKDVLAEVAHRRLEGPRLGSMVDHIANCSPCFEAYWRIRKRHRVLQAATACLLIAAVGVGVTLSARWLNESKPSLTKEVSPPPISNSPPRPPLPIAAVLDLRFSSRTRGEGETMRPAPALPRGLLNLAIRLPVGSEEGPYELALYTNAERRSELSRGQAQFREQMEVLEVRLDTGSLAPGPYELRLRPAGSTWRKFRILLK